jgi:thiamine biosynthesis lipoprotein
MSAATKHALRARLTAAEFHEFDANFFEVLFHALGARCQLLFNVENRATAEAYRNAAFDWLADYESRFSRYLPDSDLTLANARAGEAWTDVDPQFESLLDLCDHYHFVTHGAFDATSLPLSLLWDWKRQHDALPTDAEIAQARTVMGWKRLQRAAGRLFLPVKGMMLDFGGVGKELAVDFLKEMAVAMGLPNVLVDLGGDIAVHGRAPDGSPWHVGLEDPRDPSACFCGLRLRSGAAVATSGDYRRCFQLNGVTYGHILDCRTGWPVANGTRAVTVIAPRCVVAGMLSTSAMVLGGDDAITMLERTPGVEGCLWRHGRLHETRGFRRAVSPQKWQDPFAPKCEPSLP